MLAAMVTRVDERRQGGPLGDARLRGWKEIGAFLGVDERTVKRWELARGLPVRRVPGEARAPVFAFRSELTAWLASRDAPDAPLPDALPANGAGGRPRLLLTLVLAVVAMAGVLAWQWGREPAPLAADARRIAAVAALADRLEQQPGTLAMRTALAREAAAMLGRVAAQPTASTALKREAAAAFVKLARLQDNVNRPSLRNPPAARASLATAWQLVAADRVPAGRQLAARVQISQAQQDAAAGRLASAAERLARARPLLAAAPAALRDELALAEATLALWQGRYPEATRRAEAMIQPWADQPQPAWLQQLQARDAAAEGRYYQGQAMQAAALYRNALTGAQAGLRRWPGNVQLRWAVGRQQWNLGTTLVSAGQAQAALPILLAARNEWVAMAAVDPEDEALAWWSRVARLAYGEALAATGNLPAAIDELTRSLAERRAALAAAPNNVDRQRALLTGLGGLAHVLGEGSRRVEACSVLAEAAELSGRMQQAGALSPQDRDELVSGQARDRAAWCSA